MRRLCAALLVVMGVLVAPAAAHAYDTAIKGYSCGAPDCANNYGVRVELDVPTSNNLANMGGDDRALWDEVGVQGSSGYAEAGYYHSGNGSGGQGNCFAHTQGATYIAFYGADNSGTQCKLLTGLGDVTGDTYHDITVAFISAGHVGVYVDGSLAYNASISPGLGCCGMWHQTELDCFNGAACTEIQLSNAGVNVVLHTNHSGTQNLGHEDVGGTWHGVNLGVQGGKYAIGEPGVWQENVISSTELGYNAP